ncbi:replication restart helicase PriA [Candidatus Sarmatiella mevalonica]|uniref:replication restart helicase PriA n=1 Tax=Candidatus Sarmatiella mevalonica TaxID=2770581 RepID=UPI00192494C1|nr:primosomal protein N' [Candidatus Sarmatiella mevalonica]
MPIVGVSEFDYFCPKDFDVQKNQIVLVPFRKTQKIGIVTEINISASVFVLRNIIGVFPICLPDDLVYFMYSISKYYLKSPGEVARLFLPLNLQISDFVEYSQSALPAALRLKPLSLEQQKVVQQINSSTLPVLLYGVTGSGKTEVYFHLIKDVLLARGQVLILLPEISLTRQILDRFQEQFDEVASIWNSKVTIKRKKEIFYSILHGDAKVVIGARSALFLPYSNLKLIIVDEEHDASYKQEYGVLYNARDMAVLKAHAASCYDKQIRTLLCSATPSLESMYNVYCAKYDLATLSSRYGKATMPEIRQVTMVSHPKYSFLSQELIHAIQQNICNKQQTLLFLNRKGYAPIVFCKSCLTKIECVGCSVALGFYKKKNLMICNQCGYSRDAELYCHQCNTPLFFLGFGIEQLAEAITSLFPDQKIIILSRDHNASTKDNISALRSIAQGKADIVIGTQLITKGYHFPGITLVGVLDLDFSLVGADIRALEKTYQMLHQVAGRAGRSDKPGIALIQSYFADQKLFNILASSYDAFAKYELERRMQNKLPPLMKSCLVLFMCKQETNSRNAAQTFRNLMKSSNIFALRVFGPARATITKIDNHFRYKVLLFFTPNARVRECVQKHVNNTLSTISKVEVRIDFDPQNFY